MREIAHGGPQLAVKETHEMVLAPWLRQLPSKIKGRRTRRPNHSILLDDECFRFEIARERMRTDRNGSPLAILLIELPAERAATVHVDFLCHVLAERLRITDTVGRISASCLGVLLPDTTKSGAWKVASDICDVYPVGHDRPSCEVVVYPDESKDREQHTDATHDDGLAVRKNSGLEELFIPPTPKLKRAIDIFGSALGLILAAPLFAAIGAAIKSTSRGPVFYSQEREGLGGRRFQIYKLRTMRVDADRHQATLRCYSEQDGPAFKMSRDPRTTWIGRWLRRTSLDELPQLWNVLRGDMSLVGPRPLPTSESLQCTRWQRRRLTVMPGMTCIWQIWGRNTVPFDEWMRMDLQYVERRSLGFDLRLIAKTGPAIVLKQGPR
jgi:lipopolysaccharide/colanic/teichoic acid biosynthesis glycosyltransferase